MFHHQLQPSSSRRLSRQAAPARQAARARGIRLPPLAAALLAAACALPVTASAQEGLKVAVTPYNIVGVTGTQLEHLANVSRGLMELTVQSFQSQGFVALAMGSQSLAAVSTSVQAQARELGADFLFAPTLTRTADSYTMSGQLTALTDAGSSSPRMDVFASGTEGLPQTAERLVYMVTDHLFGTGPRVVSVNITGSQMLDNQAILNSLRIRQGGTYNEAKAASDIRRLYSLGYFETVEVETTDVPGGKAVHFIVTERPQILLIEYEGNEKYDDEDLGDVVGVKIMDVASDDRLLQAVANLQRFYAEKGYSQARITYDLEPAGEGRAKLIFRISGGGKIYIREIDFVGNEFYSDWKLSGVIESKTKGFISFITGSGRLDREKLANDVQLLTVFYNNNGFLQARVGEPEVLPADKPDSYTIIFPIVEGRRFKVGEVTLGGDLREDDDEEKLTKLLHIRDEDYLSREIILEDQNRLLAYYKDKGYYHAEVEPRFGQPTEDDVLDLQYEISPRSLVYYDRITIVGNEKTRDKVIRRHLEVAEGDLTSQTKLQDSQENLLRSSFFEDVAITPSPSSENPEDLLNLRVEVKERPTGAFQIGAGYSNYSSIFGTVRLSQDNLFGYGRRISLDANVGGNYSLFNLSFTDPWVGDIPLMMGFDLFKTFNEYDYYRKESQGFSLRAGYPVFEKFYLSGSYTWEDIDITDVSVVSSRFLREMMGQSKNSVFSVSLRRDTRNHFFQPSAGSTMRLTYGIATSVLGGQTSYSRYELELAKWVPMPFWRGAALMGHMQVGLLSQNREGGLPVYEKYMLGGLNTVRGYDWFEISPRDPDTGESIGGEKMGLANVEFSFPIIRDSGLYGVFFYDMGNVWTKDQGWGSGGLKKSYGAGLRYLSPMGPLRIEYGKAMDPYPGEPAGRWEFSMGAMF
ncbi:MAG: outer membrane protein assembly factor BamA [Deltaproteobacteria bacterium]|jgi:outer membrane protein insertion porin family|nr:outer membrane protein assembly factor BamA [Deltaproteobacteria bacterium]